MNTTTYTRIGSIDLLRGLVMVIMALDHVRNYFHYDVFFYSPTDLSKTSIALFITRFITHFCAPVFVFFAGTSAFLAGQRKGKKALSVWLIKRGIWLIIAELTIIQLAWFFKLDYTTILLQVIWVIGLGMLLTAGLIHLPKKWTIGVCLIVITCHNFYDFYAPPEIFSQALWTFLYAFDFVNIGGIQIFNSYPIIPWVFVMPLGYYFGGFYSPSVDPQKRIKYLKLLGLGATMLFVLARLINVYGDPNPWSVQNSFSFTILSFFNVSKYPPSLLFLMITLGPSFLFLSFAEKCQGSLARKLSIIGQVPMFFYILHLYAIHLLAVVAAMLTGFSFSDMIIDVWVTMQPELKGYGFDLWVVYLIWIFLTIMLYPICYWYKNYKQNNRDKWWLSYL